MKGRKTKIAEKQNELMEKLRERFPEQLHLIPEFIREKKLYAESEAWLGLTETGLVRIFEGFVALPDPQDSGAALVQETDASRLLSVSNEINFIARELKAGQPIAEIQQRLKNNVMKELEALNLKWISQEMKRL